MAEKKKARAIVTLEQWAKFAFATGRPRRPLYPPNRTARAEGKDGPAAEYRLSPVEFCRWRAPEYYWTTNDPRRREFGGHGIQRMAVGTWLETIAEGERGERDTWAMQRSAAASERTRGLRLSSVHGSTSGG